MINDEIRRRVNSGGDFLLFALKPVIISCSEMLKS